ncbi:MAG: hypothetical protein HYX22_00730 [Candidatus Yanofskybacteria bacterium]|nr:hypothetical protein [Candidatus Yanofskybacteria bacterium]
MPQPVDKRLVPIRFQRIEDPRFANHALHEANRDEVVYPQAYSTEREGRTLDVLWPSNVVNKYKIKRLKSWKEKI